MLVKSIIDENFNHYKKPSMVIAFPKCTFKCGKELCQNSPLATSPNIETSCKNIVDRYMSNNLTSAIVCAGLDPIDTFDDLVDLISEFRKSTDDDFVIFTGYTENEVCDEIKTLSSKFSNIVIKFGRYIPNKEIHVDEILGVSLASPNQYAKKIS